MVNKCDLYKNIQIKVGVILDRPIASLLQWKVNKLKAVCQRYLVTGDFNITFSDFVKNQTGMPPISWFHYV